MATTRQNLHKKLPRNYNTPLQTTTKTPALSSARVPSVQVTPSILVLLSAIHLTKYHFFYLNENKNK